MTKLAAIIAPLLLLVFSSSAAQADGCPPSSCGMSGSAEPGSRYLTLRTEGQLGPLVLYDVATGRRHVSLPRGVRSADGKTFLASRTLARHVSRLTRFALPSGRVVTTTELPGRVWPAAISADGRRVVLRTLGAPRGSTRFLLLDAMRVTRTVTLRGLYELETLSPDGSRLFLVHWRKHGGYDLRRYDVASSRLSATPTRSSEDGAVEKMHGMAWTAVATRNGAWLLTLYVKPEGTSFVHALDLRAGVGHCIDLPIAAGDFNSAGTAALVLSPSERTLYVAMPLVGRIFSIDLRKVELTGTARFGPLSTTRYTFGINPSAAVTPNGRMLYLGAGTSVWALDTAAARVRGPFAVGTGQRQYAVGTAVTPDGRWVRVLRVDHKLVTLDARTLSRLG